MRKTRKGPGEEVGKKSKNDMETNLKNDMETNRMKARQLWVRACL